MKPIFILAGLIALTAFLAQPIFADDRNDQDETIKALEKRIEQLEKKLQAREAKPASPGEPSQPAETPKPGPSLSIGASGVTLHSADTNFALRIRAAPIVAKELR